MPASSPIPHPHNPTQKTGILITNVGTPDGTDYKSVRRYLAQFLKDPRIIEWPKWLWYPILYGIILNRRPQRSGENYARIWNHEANEAPLRSYTRQQAEKLNNLLQEYNVIVDWGMRYGQPSIAKAAKNLIDQGCTHILLFPLFPQYCASTTASTYDAFFRFLTTQRYIPSIQTISSYATDPIYIKTLCDTLIKQLKELSFQPTHIITSFHGIPQAYSDKGDPYYQECKQTFEAIKNYMENFKIEWRLAFQSRFGPSEWIKPYLSDEVKMLAKQGVTSIAVINPGFSSDCLETVDEIGREIKEEFLEHGGKNFAHIPCLNASDEAIALYAHIIKKTLNYTN